MMKYTQGKILLNEEIQNGIYKMVVETKNEAKAGQFYMLKHNGATLLPRPISVCETNGETVTFVYAVVGRGTKEFAILKAGDLISLNGPLGNGFNVEEDLGRVALVSGGIGTAPMLEVSKRLRKNRSNIKMDLYAGFRDDIYLIDEIKEYVDDVYISTNTGKHGHKGFVTEILDLDKFVTVLCCGPEVMLKKVVDLCKEKQVKVYVYMEKHMACGVGACLVCTCKTKEGNKRTCKDGPVFDGYYVEL